VQRGLSCESQAWIDPLRPFGAAPAKLVASHARSTYWCAG